MKRILLLMILVSCVTPQAPKPSAEDPASAPVSAPIVSADQPAGSYTIKLQQTGKCIDVAANSTASGTPVQQYDCNGTTAQSWYVRDGGNGTWNIVGTNSGKCLDIIGAGVENGRRAGIWDCAGVNNQKFRPILRANGWYQLQAVHSGRALDVDLAGSYLQQWDLNPNQPNQLFGFTPIGSQPPPPPNNGGGNNGQGNNGSYVTIKVRNQCPFPLYIHGSSAVGHGTLQPDNVGLGTNQERSYQAPNLWVSARVEARKTSDLRQDPTEKVELTIDGDHAHPNLNYNVTYVDMMGLPVKVSSSGRGDDCKVAACNQSLSNFFAGCPAGLWNGTACVSLRTYCLNGQHSGEAICHTVDGKINECVNRYADCKHAAGATGPEVWACSGHFSEDPRNCAALNRGMLDNPSDANKNNYYRNAPYNIYSKFVHDKCPGLYAFPYDDYPMSSGESGFHVCRDASEMDVTFCPAG